MDESIESILSYLSQFIDRIIWQWAFYGLLDSCSRKTRGEGVVSRAMNFYSRGWKGTRVAGGSKGRATSRENLTCFSTRRRLPRGCCRASAWEERKYEKRDCDCVWITFCQSARRFTYILNEWYGWGDNERSIPNSSDTGHLPGSPLIDVSEDYAYAERNGRRRRVGRSSETRSPGQELDNAKRTSSLGREPRGKRKDGRK